MEFKKHQSIYLQIEDMICEHIITGQWLVGDKIKSVRELAANIEVNPNTVMRAYSHLQEEGIIHNKRGIGYFVSEGAPKKVMQMQQDEFIKIELAEVFRKMDILGIKFSELEKLHEDYKKTKKN